MRTLMTLFNLVGQFGLDILLQTPQQERPNDFMQALDDEECLFVQLDFVAGTGLGERSAEPFVERLTELKVLGRTKFKSAHNLGRSFWSGVPVSGSMSHKPALGILHPMTLICVLT